MKTKYFTAIALASIMSLNHGEARPSTQDQVITKTGQTRISYDASTVLDVIKNKICIIKPPLTPYLIHESDNLATDLAMSSYDQLELFDYLNDFFEITVLDEDWALCSTVGDVKQTVLTHLP